MIVVQLAGGLGNQMFQYAMGRSLAIKNSCELKLDLSFYNDYQWTGYSLDAFSIVKNIASKDDLEKIENKNGSLVHKLGSKILKRPKGVIEEEDLTFDKKYLAIRKPAYIKGFWQSELYFKEFEDRIRKEFVIKVEPSKSNASILADIETSNSISLHIRRGNYVTVEHVNNFHGTCSLDYYYQAAKILTDEISHPKFFVFSDDILWAKENLKLEYPMFFVDINDERHCYEDMRLMSHCKHHIIANSSFSWWGAWLNAGAAKKVIAPKKWLNDPQKNLYSRTLIPGSWIRI